MDFNDFPNRLTVVVAVIAVSCKAPVHVNELTVPYALR